MKPYDHLSEEDKESFIKMSNLTPDDTGLPFIVWISPGSGKEGDGVCIKVENDGVWYSMSIGDTPEWIVANHAQIPFTAKQTEMMQQFVILNKDLLRRYWSSNGAMSMQVVLSEIIKMTYQNVQGDNNEIAGGIGYQQI